MSFLIERINENTEALKDQAETQLQEGTQLPAVEKLKARMKVLINSLQSDPSNTDMTKELDAIMNILELIDDNSETGPAAKAIRAKMDVLIKSITSSSDGVEIAKVTAQLDAMLKQLDVKEKAAEENDFDKKS